MANQSLIFDAHLDLSMNALEWNRDLTRPVKEIRDREAGLDDKPDRGKGTVSLPAMREGGIGLCVATQIARYVDRSNPLPGWHSQEQAWAQTQGQLAWYKAMEDKGEMRSICNRKQLEEHLALWENATSESERATGESENAASLPAGALDKSERLTAAAALPIGYILSLEGADSIYNLSCLEKAYENGLRALGPAHYGPGVYAYGTDSSGGLGPKGRALLAEMESLGIILDVTHLCDESFWEAMSHFNGPVWASHHNARALVPHNRQFADEQFKALIERGAVIGAAFDAWMLIPGWERGKSTPQRTGVSLQHVADHIDHVCQLAGNSLHSAIGSDLDGAFGTEQSPGDMDTIADLRKLPGILAGRGYGPEDLENIMYKNWVRFLRGAWKE
jgi:membrane dipeptidase